MAARRLVIVLLVLLAASTVAAALAPVREEQPAEPRTAETEPPDREPARGERGGRLVRAAVDAAARRAQALELARGDQLSLVVRSPAADQVEIPGLGLIEDVGRYDPARFDVLATATGTFPVRLVEARRTVARIRVSPGARAGRGRSTAGARRGPPARRGAGRSARRP